MKWGPSSPPKWGIPPHHNFWLMSVVAKRLDGLYCVRWGPSFPERGTASKFRPVYCGQTAGCIKMPLGREVGLGSDDIVSDGAQLPQKGHGPNCRHVYCGQRSPISATAELSFVITQLEARFTAHNCSVYHITTVAPAFLVRRSIDDI